MGSQQVPSSRQQSQPPRKFEPRLVALNGREHRAYLLDAQFTSIGSAKSNRIVIDETTVSQQHAEIRRSAGKFVLFDLESTNGTYVNGRRVRSRAFLKQGDEVRFGAARFAFLGKPRGRAVSVPFGWIGGATLLAALFALGFVAVRYRSLFLTAHHPEATIGWEPERAQASARSTSAQPSDHVRRSNGPEPPWLTLLNRYRKLAGLSPVDENPTLSAGDKAHVRYLLTNYEGVIRSGGNLGYEMHLEHEGSPGYTPEGAAAGKASDVDYVFWSGKKPTDLLNFAIEDWISGAFHRLPLLDPGLREVGYDELCAAGFCLAALDAQTGAAAPRAVFYAAPIFLPPDGAAIDLRTFAAEWPDPLNSCPGYEPPTGLPITLTLGRFVVTKLESFSVEQIETDRGTET